MLHFCNTSVAELDCVCACACVINNFMYIKLQVYKEKSLKNSSLVCASDSSRVETGQYFVNDKMPVQY